MGKEIVYCTACGNRISSEDFDRGRASTILQRHYCRECSGDAIRNTPGDAGDDTPKTPRPLKLPARRIPTGGKSVSGPRMALPLVITVGLALLAAALLLIVLLRK